MSYASLSSNMLVAGYAAIANACSRHIGPVERVKIEEDAGGESRVVIALKSPASTKLRVDRQKPHKGSIKDWEIITCQGKRVATGIFVDHEDFAGERGQTSYIIKHDEATGEIETRNSRYTLLPKKPAKLVKRGSFMRAFPLQISDDTMLVGGKEERRFRMTWYDDELVNLEPAGAKIFANFVLDNLSDERDVWRRLVKHCRSYLDEKHVICPESSGEDRIYESAPDFVQGIADIIGYAKCAEAADVE